jgi:Protein of unknown function (DUF3128)
MLLVATSERINILFLIHFSWTAAPVHQVKQYYRYGNVDDCVEHWSNFYNCLKKRTKFADQVLTSSSQVRILHQIGFSCSSQVLPPILFPPLVWPNGEWDCGCTSNKLVCALVMHLLTGINAEGARGTAWHAYAHSKRVLALISGYRSGV